MSLWDDFGKWIKNEVADLNFEAMYKNVQEDRVYDRVKLQRSVNLCLYNAELTNRKEFCGTLAHYSGVLKDEDKFLSLEELLFLIAYCHKSLQSSFVNKMYI